MAEESINLLVTPEIGKPGGGNIRRHSSSGEKTLPHYLRASTGSCHDFCKYGRKHAFEEKVRSPMRRRSIASQLPDARSSMDEVVWAERKKATRVKLKPSPDSKIHLPASPGTIKREISLPSKKVAGPRIIKREVSLSSKKVAALLKKASPSAKGVTEFPTSTKKGKVSPKPAPPNSKGIFQHANHATPLELKPAKAKSLPSPDPLEGLSVRRNSDINIGNRKGICKVDLRKVMVAPKVTSAPKTSVDVASLIAQKNRSLNAVSPLTNQNRIRKSQPQQPKNNKVQEKTLRTSLSTKPSVKRVASFNARKYESLKVVSPLKNLNGTRKPETQQLDDDKVIEKTLYIVKTDADAKTLVSAQDASPTIKLPPSPSLSSPVSSSELASPSLSSEEEEDQESEYTTSDADDSISESDDIENMEGAENSVGETKRKSCKAGMVRSQDKDCSAVKLKFRRGKVLDIQSENKGPRRLRFRRARLLGENQSVKSDAGRRSFKRRGIDGDTNGTKADSEEKVVLRHQDVQGKKDGQGLLNNVIEETASKLVETRKSKVKALVGAFETVISLQDTKPSANTIT